jgi:hypothetical protein
LVVPGGVESQLAQQFSVIGEGADVQIANQDQHTGSGVAAAQADVVETAVAAKGDHSGTVDAVVAHAVVAGVDRGAGRDSLESGLVGLLWGGAVEGAVRPDLGCSSCGRFLRAPGGGAR